MNFINPAILAWGLPLAALPIIIHLVNRMRHTPMPWAAMMFLDRARKSSTKLNKIKQWLILACRVLAIVCLAFALSRPLAGGVFGKWFSGPPKTVIILLDRSSSMDIKTDDQSDSKKTIALSELQAAAKKIPGTPSFVIIDSATGKSREITKAEMIGDPKLWPTTDAATDMVSLMQKAKNYIKENQTGKTEIWVASDMQRSNWKEKDPVWNHIVKELNTLKQKVSLRILALNSESRNAAVSIVSVNKYKKMNRTNLQINYKVTSNQPINEKIKADIIINVPGQTAPIKVTQEIGPTESRSVDKTVFIPLGVINPKTGKAREITGGTGSIELQKDFNNMDNAAFFAYGKDRRVQNMIISTDPNSSDYLAYCAGLGESFKQFSKVYNPVLFKKQPLSNTSLIVWNERFPTPEEQEKLKAFIEEGGIVFMFASKTANEKLFDEKIWSVQEMADSEKPFRVTRWNDTSGLLSKMSEGSQLSLDEVKFAKRQKLENWGRPIAFFEDGSSYITMKRFGRGLCYVCASSPNLDWSTMLRNPLYMLAKVQRLVAEGEKRFSGIDVQTAGKVQTKETLKVIIENKASTDLKDYTVKAGVYQAGENQTLVVNRPVNEIETGKVDEKDINKMFQSLDYSLTINTQKTASADTKSELWALFVKLIFMWMIIEGFLTLNKKPREAKEQTA